MLLLVNGMARIASGDGIPAGSAADKAVIRMSGLAGRQNTTVRRGVFMTAVGVIFGVVGPIIGVGFLAELRTIIGLLVQLREIGGGCVGGVAIVMDLGSLHPFVAPLEYQINQSIH